MKNGWFTIKEVSDLFDNTRGAIRFYEEKGLIHPQRMNMISAGTALTIFFSCFT